MSDEPIFRPDDEVHPIAELQPDGHWHVPNQPDYDGFRIESIWLFTAIGDDNEEGVAAIGGMPLIAADPVRLAELRPHAEHLVRHHGARIVLRRFDPAPDSIELIE